VNEEDYVDNVMVNASVCVYMREAKRDGDLLEILGLETYIPCNFLGSASSKFPPTSRHAVHESRAAGPPASPAAPPPWPSPPSARPLLVLRVLNLLEALGGPPTRRPLHPRSKSPKPQIPRRIQAPRGSLLHNPTAPPANQTS
jgi:hypothetical protein